MVDYNRNTPTHTPSQMSFLVNAIKLTACVILNRSVLIDRHEYCPTIKPYLDNHHFRLYFLVKVYVGNILVSY